MARFAFVFFAFALFAGALASVEEAEKCRVNFLEKFALASTDGTRCDLLRLYNSCLTQTLRSVSDEDAATFWHTLVTSQASVLGCDLSKPPSPGSSLEVTEGVIDISGDEDVRFHRYRRDSVSVEQLMDDINDLQTMLASAVPKSTITTLQQTAAGLASLDDMDRILSDRLDGRMALFESLAGAYLKAASERLSLVEERLANAVSSAEMTSVRNKLKAEVDTASSAVSSALDKKASDADTSLTGLKSKFNTAKGKVDSFVSSTNQAFESLEGSVRTKLQNLEGQLRSAMADIAAQKAAATSIAFAHQTFASDLAHRVETMASTVFDKPHHIWSGFCPRSVGGDWSNYCVEVTEFNTADDYLAVANAPNGIIQIKKPGIYRINFFTITSSGSWAHVLIYINGVHRHYGHEHAHGTWTDNFADLAWPMNAGDTLYVRVYGTGNAYHSGNWLGSHSRLQVSYLGAK